VEAVGQVDQDDAAHWMRRLLRQREPHEQTYIVGQMQVLASQLTYDLVASWVAPVYERYLQRAPPWPSPYTTSATASPDTTSAEPTPPPPSSRRPPPRPPRSPARPSPTPRLPPTHGMSLRRRQ
jgi:hypothetical protein